MALTWKWKITEAGRGQEGKRRTKGHSQEVVKAAAQVCVMNPWPLPSKSCLQIQTELHMASVTINFTGESDTTEE